MRLLNRLVRGARAVARTLNEELARDRWETLQIVHRKRQRTVHHTVNQQPMLFGVNVRNEGSAMRRKVVQR